MQLASRRALKRAQIDLQELSEPEVEPLRLQAAVRVWRNSRRPGGFDRLRLAATRDSTPGGMSVAGWKAVGLQVAAVDRHRQKEAVA